ncbi:LexA family transcriptional regulator [Streptococcus sp. DD12]|uniref:LexA family transcriptional regulator n=1 Tax=Streptococcus sp. DD12 TaxID=1777880 RepID=UPI000792AF60|nr:XRE family transcriptional regulator [Streptococcus sp. DD12]KXT77035.1 Pleiotropic regulator [Streptococcus sp. DD12]
MFSHLRLKEKRLAKKLSQTQLADLLKINRSSYHSWESGRAKPNQKHLTDLALIFDVPETYFESEYPIVTSFLQLNDANKRLAEGYVDDLLQKQQDADSQIVPLYPVDVLDAIALSAGPGQSLADEYEKCTVYASQKPHGYDIATWIKGTSMSPKYRDGEVALIAESGFDYDGAVYALVWNDQTYIKKLYKLADGFRMVSINKTGNPDRFIACDDDFRIVGKVVGHFMPVKGE